MEFNWNEEDCAQQLNTKGCCFLCLDDVEGNKINGGEDRHLFSIRSLLRHLQIPSFDKQISNRKDIKVDLCEHCENIFNGFTNVLEELGKVQMKMNYFLEQINKTISSSKKDIKRVQVYSKRMTDDPKSLAQLVFVDKLRKDLAVKSLAMHFGHIPYIKIQRTEMKQKNIQGKDEDDCAKDISEMAEASDGLDNDDSETTELPEPATPITEPPPSETIKQEEETVCPKVKTSKPLKNSRNFRFIKNIQIKEEIGCTEGFSELAEVEDVFDNGDQQTSPESIFLIKDTLSKPIQQEEEAGSRKVEASKPSKSHNLNYIKITETGMYRCKKCDKICQSKQGIFSHYKTVHRKIRHKCDICNISSYVRPLDLKEHQKTCQETLEERLAKQKERQRFKFVCDLCGKRFKKHSGLVSHKHSVHKSINRHACNLCDKKYNKSSSLNNHKDSVHFGKVFYCRFCKKKFRRQTHVHTHEKICHPTNKN